MSRLTRSLRRWPVVIGLVVIVVAGGAVTAWAMARSSGSTGSSQLVAAAVNTVTSTVSASGTIEPAHQASLDFATSGRVTTVKVKVGSRVVKGQRLATVSPTALVATKDAAQATVSAAADKVAADGSSTSSVQLASDQAALSAAKSSLRSAKASLAAATLRSTIAGTVTAVNLTVGQQVSGGSSSTGLGSTGSAQDDTSADTSTSSSSSSQVVIQSARSFVVDATVDDTEISSVRTGQSVAVVPAGAATSVTGTVTSVSRVPTSSSGVVSFPIVVTVSGHPSGVYAGASATLTITTKHAFKALEIPTLAIHYNGSQATVSVNNGGGAVTRKITVGTSFGLETQVLSGIKAGDKVVVTLPTFGQGTTRGGTGGTGGFGGGFGGGTGGFGGGTGGFGGGTGGFGGRTGTGTGGFGGNTGGSG